MSRIIKYRIWDEVKEEMVNVESLTFKENNVIVATSKESYYGLVNGDCEDLMEFTGLKDKNGVDIYKGDIVKYTYWYREWDTISYEDIKEVKLINGKFVPIPEEEICDEDGWYSWGNKDFEIIGNVFKNPELIASTQAAIPD